MNTDLKTKIKKLKKQKRNVINARTRLDEQEQTIALLPDGNLSSADAIAALADKLQELTAELERLRVQK